jgi:hypothetical protein
LCSCHKYIGQYEPPGEKVQIFNFSFQVCVSIFQEISVNCNKFLTIQKFFHFNKFLSFSNSDLLNFSASCKYLGNFFFKKSFNPKFNIFEFSQNQLA